MPTPRKPTPPTAAAVDAFCAQFDDLFGRLAEWRALRQYLIGLLLPREHHKTLTVLASLVPGADRQRLHHLLHDAPWDQEALNRRRLALWREHPTLGPHTNDGLIVDETGDRKRGHGIALAATQSIGKLGHTANGVVSVTSHWADGTRHVPLGVNPYRPARRLPLGKADPAFRTKPELAWELADAASTARTWRSTPQRRRRLLVRYAWHRVTRPEGRTQMTAPVTTAARRSLRPSYPHQKRA